MKLSIAAAVAGLAAVTFAQVDLSTLPTCAQGCVGASVNVPGCSGLDIKCICNNKGYLQSLSCCLVKACKPEDQQKAANFAVQLCATAGVTVPNKVECASAGGASSSSSAASSVSSATSAASSAASGAAGSASSSASSAGSSASSALSSVSAKVSSAVASATSAGGAAASPSSAAAANVANGMGFAGAMVAAVALL